MKRLACAPDYGIKPDGQVWSFKAKCPRKIAHKVNDRGYVYVKLYVGGKMRHRFVQVLLLETYIGPRPDGMVCRHRNGNSSDNRLSNVCWGTPEENEADKKEHGTAELCRIKGSRNGQAKLTNEKVREMRSRRLAGETYRSIAAKVGVSAVQVSRVCRGQYW